MQMTAWIMTLKPPYFGEMYGMRNTTATNRIDATRHAYTKLSLRAIFVLNSLNIVMPNAPQTN